MDEALMFFSNYLPHAQKDVVPPCKPDALRKLEFQILWWCLKVFLAYAVARELLFILLPRLSSYIKKCLLRSMGSKEDTIVEAIATATEAAAEEFIEKAVGAMPSASSVCEAVGDIAEDVAEVVDDAAEAVGSLASGLVEGLATAGLESLDDLSDAITRPADSVKTKEEKEIV
jgi:hypothetical protein